MCADCALLAIAAERLRFWQAELQWAFRNGADQRAAECDLMISEYGVLIHGASNQLRRQMPGNG